VRRFAFSGPWECEIWGRTGAPHTLLVRTRGGDENDRRWLARAELSWEEAQFGLSRLARPTRYD
jgi:hypothetical protein